MKTVFVVVEETTTELINISVFDAKDKAETYQNECEQSATPILKASNYSCTLIEREVK